MPTPLLSRSLLFLCLSASAVAADSEFLSLAPTYLPSYVGLGIGPYPEYIGADETTVGAAPIARYTFGEQRYIALEVSYARINLLENRNWRFGPAGMYRFGREDVKDDVVAKLPDVDGSLELGAFVAYEDVGKDPRNRWVAGASFLHGVWGDNDGYTISVNFNRWVPVGRYAALGLYTAASFGSSEYMSTYFSVTPAGAAASGLPVFDAGSGVRDLRFGAVFIQPLSREWQVGTGFLYSRLLGDAADSPIVSERGDRNQFVYGVGFTRAF
nr:MipA/OmpV family protein [Ruegeria arenilitoris]